MQFFVDVPDHENMCTTFVRTIFCLVTLAISVIIAAPVAVIVVILMSLSYQIYYAFILARRNQNDAALVFAQHALTTSVDQSESTVHQMLTSGFEYYEDDNFWLALAGVPVARAALAKAFGQYIQENNKGTRSQVFDGQNEIRECNRINVDQVIRNRAALDPRKRSEIDFEQLIQVNWFVEFGSQTSYALRVLTEYAVQSVKIHPSTLQDLKQELRTLAKGAKTTVAGSVKAATIEALKVGWRKLVDESSSIPEDMKRALLEAINSGVIRTTQQFNQLIDDLTTRITEIQQTNRLVL